MNKQLKEDLLDLLDSLHTEYKTGYINNRTVKFEDLIKQLKNE